MARKTGRRKFIPIAILIASVIVASVSGYLLGRGGPTIVSYTTYTSDNYSFKFDYPANWNFFGPFHSGLPPVVAAFRVFQDNDFAYSLRGANMWLVIYNKAEYENSLGMSLDNLTSLIYILETRRVGVDVHYEEISKPAVINIDNHIGVTISYKVNVYPYARVQLVTAVNDNYFYEFGIAAPSENYLTYKLIFQHVLDSFSFLD